MRAEGLEKLIQQSARTATHDKTASSSARKKGARQPRDGGGDDDDDEDAPMTGNDLTEAIEACAAMLAELEVRRPSARGKRATTKTGSSSRASFSRRGHLPLRHPAPPLSPPTIGAAARR